MGLGWVMVVVIVIGVGQQQIQYITVRMKKQLTDKDRQLMRKSLQKFEQKGTVIVYGLAIKQSGTGVFTNQRLLLLNSSQKSIRYYSKEPPNLPFTKIEQIPEGKTKLVYDQVHFKCQAVKGKTSTMKIQWEQNKKVENWIFTFAKSTTMHQFVAAVEEVIAGNINKDPTFVNKQPDNPNKPPDAPANTSPLLNNPQNNNTTNQSQPKQNIQKTNPPASTTNPDTKNKNPPTQTKPTSTQPLQQTSNQSQQQPQQQPQQQQQQPPAQTQQQPPTQTQQPTQTTQPSKTEPTKPAQQKPTYSSFQSQKQPQPTQQPQNTNSVPTAPTSSFLLDPATAPNNNNTNNKSQPGEYTDVSQEIRALKEKDPKRFNLTNQLSKKNLNEDPNFILSNPNDNVQTKREPENVNYQQKPTEPSFSKTKPQQNPINNSRTTQNPQPYQTQPQPLKPQQPIGYQDKNLRKNPTNKQLQSQPQPQPQVPQQSRSYLTQQQPQNPNAQARSMQRVQSQQPPYNSYPENNSRIRSQHGYDTNQRKNPNGFNRESKRWNQIWCTTPNPLDIYEEFVEECHHVCKEIIDELPTLKSLRQYSPIKNEGPYYLYNIGGITYNMHYFGDEAIPPDSNRDQDEKAPLLFDHESYFEAERQFYNYNFVLSITGNKGIIKVPLACYIEYKGVLIVCRANMPEFFNRVSPHQYQKNLQNLQQLLHIRFVFNSLSIFAHPQKKYFLLCDLQQLIPRIPLQAYPPSYFRKQFLLQNNFMIDDQNSVSRIFNKLVNENVKEFITRFESFQSWVINSEDLVKELHRSGISMGCIPLIFQQTSLPFLKKVLMSEMTKSVFCDILRSELNSVYASIPTQQVQNLTPQYIEKIVIDCTHVLLDQLFSYGTSSENIWRLVVREVNKRFKVVVSKEDILPGYLLGGIMATIGITCDYKTPNLSRKDSFFVRQNTIPRDMLLNFHPRVRRYDLDTISPQISRIKDILESQPSPDNFQQLIRTLSLKSKQIPSFCQPIKPQIMTYLCNFIPLGDHQEFDHIGIYDMLETQPHTYCSTKISLLGIKWAAKKKNDALANKLFEIKSEENSFWVSEFNPAISQFYDFFSLYNVSIGNYDQAVKLAKSSLINSIKLTGPNSLPVADKHYQLGNIYFKIGRKEQSLKQYLKTKQILEQHKQTAIPEYGVILLKLSLLYLNFGKISDCVGSSLEALKIFDTNGGNQQEEIETFEILARSYEITRKTGDLASVGALCSQKFNNTQTPKILQRMIKIVLLPKLSTISHEDAKTLLKITSKLQQLQSPVTYIDCFNYLHYRAQSEVIMKRLFIFIENVSNLYEDVMRKDLFRKHKSLSSQAKSQAADMLVLLEAVLVMTGYNFVNGSLKENYY